jgi:O-antigen/teichoic acid export membrane protein
MWGKAQAMRPSAGTLKQGAFALADQIVVSGASFVLSVMVARACSKGEFGSYVLGASILFIFMNLQTSLVAIPCITLSPRFSETELPLYTGSIFVHSVALGILASVVIAVGAALTSIWQHDAGFSSFLWVLAAAMPFLLLRDCVRQVVLSRLDARSAFHLDVRVSVLAVAVAGALWFGGWLSPQAAYAVLAVSCLLSTVIWTWTKSIKIVFTREATLSHLAANWWVGRWQIGASAAYLLSRQPYVWLLAAFHGVPANAAYGACNSVTSIVLPFVMGLNQFLAPKVAHRYVSGGKHGVRVMAAMGSVVFAIIVGAFCLVLSFFGTEIFRLIYGASYAQYGSLVGLFALAQFSSVTMIPLNQGLVTVNRPDIGFYSNLIGLAVTVTFGVYMTYHYQVKGVAQGLLAASILSGIYCIAQFRKQVSGTRPAPAEQVS